MQTSGAYSWFIVNTYWNVLCLPFFRLLSLTSFITDACVPPQYTKLIKLSLWLRCTSSKNIKTVQLFIIQKWNSRNTCCLFPIKPLGTNISVPNNSPIPKNIATFSFPDDAPEVLHEIACCVTDFFIPNYKPSKVQQMYSRIKVFKNGKRCYFVHEELCTEGTGKIPQRMTAVDACSHSIHKIYGKWVIISCGSI